MQDKLLLAGTTNSLKERTRELKFRMGSPSCTTTMHPGIQSYSHGV
jgi:hypothetical protein